MQNKQKKFKVKILRDLCIGSGSCEAIAPKVFKLDQEDRAVLVDQRTKPDSDGFVEVTQDTLDRVLAAAKSCPVLAIIVVDKNGNQIYPA